jgi:5-hydroxyisourate hydrolase
LSAITTHVLDTALGQPAAGVPVRLERVGDGGGEAGGAGTVGAATAVATSTTGEDGRAGDLGPAAIEPGTYSLVFDTAAYYRAQPGGEPPFFPEVTVSFTVRDPAGHYHVPLLLSPYGYTTYRGS